MRKFCVLLIVVVCFFVMSCRDSISGGNGVGDGGEDTGGGSSVGDFTYSQVIPELKTKSDFLSVVDSDSKNVVLFHYSKTCPKSASSLKILEELLPSYKNRADFYIVELMNEEFDFVFSQDVIDILSQDDPSTAIQEWEDLGGPAQAPGFYVYKKERPHKRVFSSSFDSGNYSASMGDPIDKEHMKEYLDSQI